jgi:hypothetical protein
VDFLVQCVKVKRVSFGAERPLATVIGDVIASSSRNMETFNSPHAYTHVPSRAAGRTSRYNASTRIGALSEFSLKLYDVAGKKASRRVCL